MRVLWPLLAYGVCLSAATPSRVDPKIISIYPFTGQKGTTLVAVARGVGLQGASAVHVETAGLSVKVERVEPEPVSDTANTSKKSSIDLVTIHVAISPEASAGSYPIRLISRNGISNALPIQVVDLPVVPEPAGTHESAEAAIRIDSTPTVLSGRLSRRGEADYYSFRADAGQTFTFEVTSGLPQIASGGSAATIANFDPSISIYASGSSWFDSKRLRRIAYNDEPTWVFGQPTDAHLVHRFANSGEYLLRIEAFAGQGGPDYGYRLQITPGETAPKLPSNSPGWHERTWTRKLDSNRLSQLAARGGIQEQQQSVETYRASSETTAFKLPGTIEGILAQAGESHRARFQIDRPTDIAIEIETPKTAPPHFNPIARLLNESGEEVATNIFSGLGACSGALTKSSQAKTILPLRDTGAYTLEIRDATSDLAGPDFQYRVQVRPQTPHIGDIRIDADHINLSPGEAKTIRVAFDREEDYRGALAVFTESLPSGVTAAVGADYEPDTDPPLAKGKRERYTPRTERTVVILSASPDAAPTQGPQKIRLVTRPVVDGKLGETLSTKSLYLMVIEKP